jgi:hypothetical protein
MNLLPTYNINFESANSYNIHTPTFFLYYPYDEFLIEKTSSNKSILGKLTRSFESKAENHYRLYDLLMV